VLPTASLSIGDILSGAFLFNVPAYQRPYSWTREQTEQLLDDLLEAGGLGSFSDAERSYFLGTVLLMDPSEAPLKQLSPKMAQREFDVVDGQQRLVTLMMMFAVLRDLEDADRSFIKRRVHSMLIAQKGTRFFPTLRPRLHIATRERAFFETNVLTPGATLQTTISSEPTAPEHALLSVRDGLLIALKELSEDVREDLFRYVCDNCFVVAIVSDDIDYAHRVFIVLNERGKKLQRNDILKADVLSRLPAGMMDEAHRKWDETSSELGGDFESLFTHIRTIYGQSRPQIVSGVRHVIDLTGGAAPFFNTVFVPFSQSYKLMRSGGVGVLPAPMIRSLMYLNRLPEGDWAPAAMLALASWERDPQSAARLLAEIDRLAHVLRILCAGTGKRVRRFADVVRDIRAGTALAPGQSTFAISRDETRNMGFHLRDLHKRNPKICKLLLLRLSDEIDGVVTAADPENYTIEHVLPQRPSATSEWRRWFPNAEERNISTESLGNLVLITQKQNDKARNVSFAEKKKIYGAPEPRAPLLAITRDVLMVEEWRRFEIEAREDRLLKVLEQIWRLDLSSARQGGKLQPTPSVA
jgi:hypothetical protein